MLSKPGVVEAQTLGEQNLLEQFRYPGARLIITERAEPH